MREEVRERGEAKRMTERAGEREKMRRRERGSEAD